MDVYIARTERQYRKSWYIIHLEQMLKKGSGCEVDITYAGNLTTNETTGLYRSAYMDSKGQKQWALNEISSCFLTLSNHHNIISIASILSFSSLFLVSALSSQLLFNWTTLRECFPAWTSHLIKRLSNWAFYIRKIYVHAQTHRWIPLNCTYLFIFRRFLDIV